MSASEYKQCTLCPRKCKADRTQTVGFCGMGDKIIAAKAMIHTAEEPCISGTRGSGAIFFSGCVLRCAFCQNHDISHGRFGMEITPQRLGQIILSLQSSGVHNINLVSGTQFYPSILHSIDAISDSISVPVIWNTGGYETPEAIERLSRYCSVFLQDVKFFSQEVSRKYSSSGDYFYHAVKATELMLEKAGDVRFDSDGMIQSGVIVRHLVLPSNRKDSIELLRRLKDAFGTKGYMLSLMSQYTPPAIDCGYPELGRRITSFEYQSVCDVALELGFDGYFQDKISAQSVYTPTFDLQGL